MTRSPRAGVLRRLLGAREEPGSPAAVEPETTTEADREIIRRASEHSMTGPLRLQSLIDAVRYCEAERIPGAFAECGVWRGGSVLAMILTLQEIGAERDIYLYDTFEGMTEPTEHDVSALDPPALETWESADRGSERPWAELFDSQTFNQEAVHRLLLDTGYPSERLHLIRGPVEETLPVSPPGPLALLRLDTDWYESTRAELEHLYPLLALAGVLIIDDYGHWDGARKAVDEYFENGGRPLLTRIDYTGRIGVKR
jgi:O-methyltransferase